MLSKEWELLSQVFEHYMSRNSTLSADVQSPELYPAPRQRIAPNHPCSLKHGAILGFWAGVHCLLLLSNWHNEAKLNSHTLGGNRKWDSNSNSLLLMWCSHWSATCDFAVFHSSFKGQWTLYFWRAELTTIICCDCVRRRGHHHGRKSASGFYSSGGGGGGDAVLFNEWTIPPPPPQMNINICIFTPVDITFDLV